jgi:hypothetical protein
MSPVASGEGPSFKGANEVRRFDPLGTPTQSSPTRSARGDLDKVDLGCPIRQDALSWVSHGQMMRSLQNQIAPPEMRPKLTPDLQAQSTWNSRIG